MQELTMTPATVVLMVPIAAWAVWAVRRMFFRGLCDCHGSNGHKGKKGGEPGAAGPCAGCSACHGCPACTIRLPESTSTVPDSKG